jgi:predicted alpha/beta superfamily hydrolase
MKIIFKILIVLIYLALNNVIHGQAIGNVEKIEIQSKTLNQNREILVYTPSYYKESIYQYYDVIFVFDAQNRELFDLTHSLITLLDENKTEKPFIVIGISAYTGKDKYARNDDFLPFPKYDKIENNLYGFGHANRQGFSKYIKQEVLPFLEKNYRLSSRKLAVGHSLGASYAISTLIHYPKLFSSYIAISPNFGYDKERLANELINYKFDELEKDKFLFISHADEQNYWKGWKESRDKVYAFFNSLKQPKILFKNREYIDKGHRTSFLSALYDGMKEYTKYLDSLTSQKHVIEITVNVPNKTDEVYITGNQKELGNWEEGKIKMDSISPFKRKISLTLVNKTQIRFTNGNSKSNKVAEIENYDLPWLFYIPISTEFESSIEFNILDWTENSF